MYIIKTVWITPYCILLFTCPLHQSILNSCVLSFKRYLLHIYCVCESLFMPGAGDTIISENHTYTVFFIFAFIAFCMLLLLSRFSCVQLCADPTRLPRPWGSPGKNTEVGCHFLLQCMKVKRQSEVAQSCPTLSNLMDCSLPGSSRIFFFLLRRDQT